MENTNEKKKNSCAQVMMKPISLSWTEVRGLEAAGAALVLKVLLETMNSFPAPQSFDHIRVGDLLLLSLFGQ